MNYQNELISITECCHDKSKMIKLSLNKEDRQKIIDATSFMDSFYKKIPLKIRCLAVVNDYTEKTFPKCPECGAPVGYDKEYQREFNTFCSDKCSKAYGRLPAEVNGKLEDFDWMYKHRIADRMSYQSIGDLLGISDLRVKTACIALKLPRLRYNESTSEVMVKLNDKEFLAGEYAKGKTLQEIADDIGTSKATAQKVFKVHAIEARSPNAYKRKKNKRSKEEIEFEEYINSLGVVTENSNRSILGDGMEIDILCPSLNIGFEYNGIYSHLEENGKGPKYHVSKTDNAKVAGVKLFHIFSDDWVLKKDIVKSIVANKLGSSQTTIYARCCLVSSITPSEKNVFLDQNHLQGKDGSNINYALVDLTEGVVAVMTFGKSRYNKNVDWELMRFACKKNVNVVGGFSRLLSRFKNEHSGSIVSYADRSISDGGVYAKNGFVLDKINPPGYKYVNLNKSLKRMHRAAFMKGKIAEVGDPRSEKEIMLSMNYKRIWDCGTLTYVMK